MNEYLKKHYALLGTETDNNDGLTRGLRKIMSNPAVQYIIFGIVMCIVGILAIEKVLPYSWQSAFATTFSYAIASIGFCLLMGYSGLASLGTGGFIGIGTYAVHYIMSEAHLPFIVAVIVALAVSIAIGLIVGFISLRIEGIYLVILTLALSEILKTLYAAIEPKLSLSSKDALLFGVKFPTSSSLILVSVFLVIVMIITTNLINSPTGRAMLAMKNSTAAAQAMGINLIKYRLMSFVICTAYASITGVLLMMVVRSADATDPTGYYALITSLNILAAVIIGGYKSIWGAVFGTFIMYGIKLVIFNQIPFLADNSLIITLASGVLVIVIAMYYPGGLAQLLLEFKGKYKTFAKKVKEGIYGKDLG